VDIVTVAPKPVPVKSEAVFEDVSVGRRRLQWLFSSAPSHAAVLGPPA
jgi:hypothetical protein